MSISPEEIVRLEDPAIILTDINQYQATRLISHLRRSDHLDLDRRTSLRIAEILHQNHPDDLIIVTVFCAVLKDVGQLRRAADILALRLREDCTWYFLRVVGSVLWKMTNYISASFAFDLADFYETTGVDNFSLTQETIETLRARLRGTWLPDNAFYRLREEGKHPFITTTDLARLETPIPIPGLDGFTLRPLKSKRQLTRVANQMNNCLNSYLKQVENGTTLLFAVERDGTPVEAIEINPASRQVVQWKGERNTNPSQTTKPFIQRILKSVRPSTKLISA